MCLRLTNRHKGFKSGPQCFEKCFAGYTEHKCLGVSPQWDPRTASVLLLVSHVSIQMYCEFDKNFWTIRNRKYKLMLNANIRSEEQTQPLHRFSFRCAQYNHITHRYVEYIWVTRLIPVVHFFVFQYFFTVFQRWTFVKKKTAPPYC